MTGRTDTSGGRQPPSVPRARGGRSITFWVYHLAALLIFLSTASLTFVAYMAWLEADKRALESEQFRLSYTLENIFREIARDQIVVAQWDTSFNALQAPLDKDFIEEEFIEELAQDFGFQRTFLVGVDGNLLAQAIEDNTRFDDIVLAPDNQVRQLAETTRQAFEDRKKASSSVFAEWYVPQSALIGIAATSFTVLDGSPALLSAIPVLPDDGNVRFTSHYPVILVNAVYLDKDWLADLNERLAYRDLKFFTGTPERMHPTNHLIHAADGSVFGYFKWDHAKPGRDIWMMAVPMIVVLALITAVVAFTAANRISRLSASLEESERRNRHFALHDPLTGLPNRHHFSDCLSYSLDGLPESGFAVLACDLDRFKPVNDSYGHEAGDKALCVIAERLSKLVSEDGVVSRIGGDEFIILLTQSTDRQALSSLAQQILSDIARPIDLGDGRSVEIGISLGIAAAPECGTNEKDLIRMADMALYRAKENGRNGFEFAGPHSVETAQSRGRMDLKTQPTHR
ncbi:diguanylate cyclase domain-containing protein [Labrenzia sp. VG12]|uniref:diguanylate cyclase domain-containing protein n=1 Tax=Labrenzia sp. VG12 TaxID=2021862 RepID=UPI0012FD0601|nr:diguanylate cyclase [Labrenzia sp. VG12]